MAQIDSNAGEIVISVVYDGPPEAGKTTSLRALAGSLTRHSSSPEEDSAGRTLWFDWMEYVGGRFEGCQIRCQIIGVPGQRELAARRRRVIAGADVVVFVADSGEHQTARTLETLRELRAMLGDDRDAPVGVILQANKRDLPDAVPIEELRARLDDMGWPIGVVEAVASDGTGIRETFVYAVRLALDRVRVLIQRGALPTTPNGPRSADELLAVLRAEDRVAGDAAAVFEDPDSPAAQLLREVLACEERRVIPVPIPMSPGAAPRPPTIAVPSGAIWPPVEGRAMLCELASLELVPRRLPSGDWAAGLGSGWRVVSHGDAVFDSLDAGRNALIQWARLHAGAIAATSPRRAIVLAEDGAGRWRLWQLVRAEHSLREAVDRALGEPTRDGLTASLGRVAQLLVEADARLGRLPLRLPCTLDSIGPSDAGAVYIGLMPAPAAAVIEPRPRRDSRSLLLATLDPVVAHELRGRALSLDDILGHLQQPEGIARAVSALLGA